MAKVGAALRLEEQDLLRVDALAPLMSTPGLDLNRSDVLRVLVMTALPLLEAKHGVTQGKKKGGA